MIKYMVLLLYEHLDVLLIFNCLDCGPWTIFGSNRGSKFDAGSQICEQLFKIVRELQYAICDVSMKSSCYKGPQ